MLVYLGLFIALLAADFLTLLIPKRKTQRLILLLFSFLLLFLFVGLRSIENSPDGQQYFDFYAKFSLIPWSSVFSQNVEFGYVIFNKLCSFFHLSYIVFQLIYAFLVWGLFTFFISVFSSDFRLSFFCLVVFGLYFTMTAFRQALAAAFLLGGCALLKIGKTRTKQLLFFYLFAFIAFSFHKTSIFAILIPIALRFIRFRKPDVLLFVSFYAVVLACCRSVYSSVVFFYPTAYAPITNNSLPEMSIFYASIFLLGSLFLYSTKTSDCINGLFLKVPFRFSYIDSCGGNGCKGAEESASIRETQPANSLHRFFYFYRTKDLSSDFTSLFLFFVAICSYVMAFSLVNVVFARFYYYAIGFSSIIIGNAVIRQKSSLLSIIASLVAFALMILYFFVTLKNSGFWGYLVPYHLYS